MTTFPGANTNPADFVTRCPSCPLWPCRRFRARPSARGRLPSATDPWPADIRVAPRWLASTRVVRVPRHRRAHRGVPHRRDPHPQALRRHRLGRGRALPGAGPVAPPARAAPACRALGPRKRRAGRRPMRRASVHPLPARQARQCRRATPPCRPRRQRWRRQRRRRRTRTGAAAQTNPPRPGRHRTAPYVAANRVRHPDALRFPAPGSRIPW